MSYSFTGQAQRDWRTGQLSARPGTASQPPLRPGLHRMTVGSDNGGAGDSAASEGGNAGYDDSDAVLLVPAVSAGAALPLVVLLHGASSRPDRALRVLQVLRADAERDGFLLLAPKSHQYSWDIITGGFGPDIATLDRLLTEVLDRFEVDPARIALAGFSDGASYALSVGLINGELFSRVLAFSPGFVLPGRRAGKPAVFLSHGDGDTVLPIDRCGRPIAAQLRADGYPLDYREFAGGHDVPPELATAAVRPLAG